MVFEDGSVAVLVHYFDRSYLSPYYDENNAFLLLRSTAANGDVTYGSRVPLNDVSGNLRLDFGDIAALSANLGVTCSDGNLNGNDDI